MTYLAVCELVLGRRLVLVERGIEARQRDLVGLADILELLDVSTSGRKVDFSDLQGRPELSNLLFKLLFAAEIGVDRGGGRCSSGGRRGASFVNTELLLVALELLGEVRDTVLEVLLAGFGPNEGLTCPGNLLVLEIKVSEVTENQVRCVNLQPCQDESAIP